MSEFAFKEPEMMREYRDFVCVNFAGAPLMRARVNPLQLESMVSDLGRVLENDRPGSRMVWWAEIRSENAEAFQAYVQRNPYASWREWALDHYSVEIARAFGVANPAKVVRRRLVRESRPLLEAARAIHGAGEEALRRYFNPDMYRL